MHPRRRPLPLASLIRGKNGGTNMQPLNVAQKRPTCSHPTSIMSDLITLQFGFGHAQFIVD